MIVVECLTKSITEDEITYNYYYRVTRHELQIEEESGIVNVQTYGIEVERNDYNGGILINIERNSINNVSPQRHIVHNLMKMLYDNSVSPIHLVDVLGEEVDDHVSDFCSICNGVAVEN